VLRKEGDASGEKFHQLPVWRHRTSKRGYDDNTERAEKGGYSWGGELPSLLDPPRSVKKGEGALGIDAKKSGARNQKEGGKKLLKKGGQSLKSEKGRANRQSP